MPAKSKKQQRLMGMVHHCKKTGECASDTVKKIAKSMKDSDAKDFAETKHKNLPNKVTEYTNMKPTFKEYLIEGYYTRPAIDRERYPDREHEGLEGPFTADNGKVYYYDKKEGKNYDPDTDYYLSDDDMQAMAYSPEKTQELMNAQRRRDFEKRR